MKDSWASILRGSFLGFRTDPRLRRDTLFVHGLYDGEKFSKNKANFGRAPFRELLRRKLRNGAAGGAMIPLLTLGIPGTGTTAVLMGALIDSTSPPEPPCYSRTIRRSSGD